MAKSQLKDSPTTFLPYLGTSEGMISTRAEEHVWLTGDGGVHVLVNFGGGSNALTLCSSYDLGSTWQKSLALPLSDANSHADGQLRMTPYGMELDLVYRTELDSADIRYTSLNYDENTHAWTQNLDATLFSHHRAKGDNPTVVRDQGGDLWACVSVTLRGKTALGVFHSANEGKTWSKFDELTQFSANKQQSASLLALEDGSVGAVYSCGDSLYWTEFGTVDQGAPPPVLLLKRAGNQSDPTGSHFNAVVAEDGDILVATNDGNYGLVALTRNAASGEWQKSAVPTVYGASYMQASYADSGEWLVACNLKQQENDVALFVSQDDGATFSSLIELALPGNDTGNARIELPAQIGDWLPVFVQMENNQGLQQLSVTGIAQKGVDGLWG